MDVFTLLHSKGDGVHSVRPDETVEAVLKVLRRHNIGAAVVIARFGEVLGIVSERDLVRGLAERGAAALKAEIHEFMTYRAVTCHPDDDLRDVMEKMDTHNVRHLPVVSEEGLVGMLSIRDVNRVRLAAMEMEHAVLKDYATTTQTVMALR